MGTNKIMNLVEKINSVWERKSDKRITEEELIKFGDDFILSYKKQEEYFLKD